MRNKINSPFTLQEAEHELLATNSTKAPGPDGMNVRALKSLWHVIRGNYMEFLTKFDREGHIPSRLNWSLIALIPKSSNPSTPAQFRPISLMNASVKLLTKILTLRLRKAMNTLVSETKSAIIRKRQMSDCILITSEVYDALKSKNSREIIVK